MDVVYILGNGSQWNNIELAYSLRSLEKHGHNVEDVYVVGGPFPEWLNLPFANLIKMEDPHECKQRNMMEKIAYVCQYESLSDDFLFMNDDHFMLQDFDANTYPYYFKNLISQQLADRSHKANDHYGRALLRTMTDLMTKNNQAYNFDIHTPIRYNKTAFRYIMSQYNWEDRFGYVIKSLYTNSAGIIGEYRQDCKINTKKTELQIRDRIKDLDCFSIGDRAICGEMLTVLNDLYPVPCKYEIRDANN